MASLPSVKTVSYEEWLEMPEVRDAIEEVVNGEIRIIPPPKLTHALIVHKTRRALEPQFDPDEVLVFDTLFGLIIRTEPLVCRVPDIAVFIKSTMVERDGYIHSAPQLVVEVLSPSNTRAERAEKLDDYASLGVPEVWVVSPEGRTVEVLLLEEGRYRRSQLLAEGFLQPKLFPNVRIDVMTIWP